MASAAEECRHRSCQPQLDDLVQSSLPVASPDAVVGKAALTLIDETSEWFTSAALEDYNETEERSSRR